jgi:LmbE family N-acetylglucosaminyl deacetylase
MESVPLDADDRVLVVAPHPDDETLGAGGLIQHAQGAAATLAVVFLTDGDNNPWAQRATELRWRIGSPERGRFAARRRAEALAALQALGADPAGASFMGLPDQGLTSLLLRDGVELDRRLRGIFASFSPTLVVGPSFADLHPDHSAAAVALDIAAGPCSAARLRPLTSSVWTLRRAVASDARSSPTVRRSAHAVRGCSRSSERRSAS